MSSDSPPNDSAEENPFTFTTEIIILLAVAVGLLFILIICCCCIVKKRREKTIEVTPSAIREGRVTPSQLLDAGMSPQSVVEIGAATPEQLVEEGLAKPHEVDLKKDSGPKILYQAGYPHPNMYPPPPPPPPARLAAPEELLEAGYTPSQLSTYDVIHRNKENAKGKKVVTVGSDETLQKESKSPKKLIVEPSHGTIYNGPIKRTVNDIDNKKNKNAGEKTVVETNSTFSTWMAPKTSKAKKSADTSTVPSNYQQVDKSKKAGRVVVIESNVSRKGSMATDVNVYKESKVSDVSNVKNQSPSMKTQGKRSNRNISKTISKKVKSMSPSSKKGKSKYDVDD